MAVLSGVLIYLADLHLSVIYDNSPINKTSSYMLFILYARLNGDTNKHRENNI